MDFKGYKVTEGKNSLTVEGVCDFDTVRTFECGQCFRWIRENDGSYTGAAGGRVANVSFSDDRLVIKNAGLDDFTAYWYDYLDLGRDYGSIKKRLAEDEVLKKAIPFGEGIRLLRQDLWETLVSFIISANNRIPMIMKVVAAVCEAYGDPLEYGGRRFYTFPSADRLAASCLDDLKTCRGGFRCRYILETSRLVAGGGFNLGELAALDTERAREMLTRLPGVGEKVADCTLLYSGLKQDVFPTDVWIKRVVEELYFGRPATMHEIRRFSQEKFGELAGIAQQFLFYYARENRIGAR